MASRLDPHLIQIFERLHERAESYRTVCAWLTEVGVRISAQALRTWHIRKTQKISGRKQLLGPSSANGAATPLPKPVGGSGISGVCPALGNHSTQSTLAEQIRAEESRLQENSNGPADGFVVRAKKRTTK
jgi:hypothetical protein